MAKVKIDKEVCKDLERLGINTEIVLSERTYVLNPIPLFLQTENIVVIEPRKIKQECLIDFMQYCEKQIDPAKEKEEKKLMFVKSVLLDKNFSLILNHFMGSLYKNTRATLRENFNPKKIAEGARLSEIVKREIDQKLLEDIILNEVFTFLDSKPDKDAERNKTFERILRKYKPEIYEDAKGTAPPELKDIKKVVKRPLLHPLKTIGEIKRINKIRKKLKTGELLGDCYELQLSRSPKDMNESAVATNASCLRHGMGYFEDYAQDIGTLFFVARKNGKPLGYERMFLMESDENEPMLAIDTMEPPRKDFETHLNLINAMAVAAIELGLDLGTKYILCSDSRIKYGPRQAFGNTEKSIRIRKIGATTGISSYNTSPSKDYYSTTPFVLMENWRR